MELEEKIKEKRKIEKAMEIVELKQTLEIAKASSEGTELPIFTEEETMKMIESEYEKMEKEESSLSYRISHTIYTKQHFIDWVLVALALIVLTASFFMPRFEIAWMFSITLLGSILIRHPISRLASVIFTFNYFLGVLTSGYWLTLDQIWLTTFGINKIFKYAFIIGSMLSFSAFTLGIISGSKDLPPRYLGMMTLAFMGMALAVSFLDLAQSSINYLYYPTITGFQIFLIDSAGFFVSLTLWWIFWYSISKISRKLILKRKHVQQLIEVEEYRS